MPRYVVTKIQDALNRYKKPRTAAGADLGVAYKPNVNDLRESPAFDVITAAGEGRARFVLRPLRAGSGL
jgi:UDP-N-acetyl-D-glucosamine dehydrogenase